MRLLILFWLHYRIVLLLEPTGPRLLNTTGFDRTRRPDFQPVLPRIYFR